MSSGSSSSPSTSDSNSRRRVRFMDADIFIPYTPSEAVSGSSTEAPLHSSASTTDSDSLIPPLSDAVVLLETEAFDPDGVILHPCLTIFSPVHWNMLIDPQIAPRPHALVQYGHDFMTLNAFSDSISQIRINCNMLPWQIIVHIKQDGIDRSPLIDDICNLIYVSLWKLASSVDFNNQTTERQRRIQKAYRGRCRQFSLDEKIDGLRRIDFLEIQTMFLGLSSGNCDDEWELHVGYEY